MPAENACPGLFVTGTDTGVGKTMVAAALARYYRQRGLKIGVMKPCETGVNDPRQPGDDARLLRWAAGSCDDDRAIAPYRLREPLAPSLAAEREGVIIDPAHIGDSFAAIRTGKDLVIVEGAGGLMVPLRGGYLMADLVRELRLPMLVVSRASLGTINHTLLTIFAARAMELPLTGFMINRMPTMPDLAEQEAPHQLASLASADLLGVLPEVAGSTEEQVDRLADAIGALPTLSWLNNSLGLSGLPHP
ncbi:MAG: dethiobiotin synthase [Desulfuromonadales bacterium]|nr:dethiobiotin synthase [Desulfuromonadales bacterium]